MKHLICETIHGYQADLTATARDFHSWREHWRDGQETTTDREKWDHYKSEYIEKGPQWELLTLNGKYDLLRIALDRCLGHLSGHPGPVVRVSLKWTVRILQVRPELVRGTYGQSDSLLLRLQGITSEACVPDGVSDAHWKKLMTVAVSTLMSIDVIHEEYKAVSHMLDRVHDDHPLASGFRAAEVIVRELVKDRCHGTVTDAPRRRSHRGRLLVTVS